VRSQLRTISPQPPISLTSAPCIASFTEPCVTIGSCFSAPTAEALLADERLEVLPAPDPQSVTWEDDKVNPLPKPP